MLAQQLSQLGGNHGNSAPNRPLPADIEEEHDSADDEDSPVAPDGTLLASSGPPRPL